MQETGLSSQACFHPMYRMRARNSRSPVDRTVFAVWIDKYADVVPEVNEGIAKNARSFHFGLPLWFFNHSTVDSIADVVFDEWGIREE